MNLRLSAPYLKDAKQGIKIRIDLPMTKNFPINFKVKTSSKAMSGFCIAFLMMLITVSVYLLIYESKEIQELSFLLFGIIIFMLFLLGFFIWSELYVPSTLKFYEDHLAGESVLGLPTVIYYTDIESIDITGIHLGGAFILKTKDKSLELSSQYNNHEKMYEILENQIRPVFEKKCMEKLEKNHTFICQNPALSKITIWFIILLYMIVVLFCIYWLLNNNESSERVACYLGIVIFGCGGLLALKFAKIIHTQYLFNMRGIEVKNRFSSRKYQWEQFIDIEYKFIGGKEKILSMILKTADHEKIAFSAILNNFGVFYTIAKARIQYDERKGQKRDEESMLKIQRMQFKWAKWVTIPIVCVALPVLVLILGVPQCIEEYKLDHSGKVVNGKLTAKKEGYDNTRYFKYEFYINAMKYKGKKKVWHNDYDNHKEGDILKIEYLPDDPGTNRPKEMTVRDSPSFYIVFGISILMSIMVIYSVRQYRKKAAKYDTDRR